MLQAIRQDTIYSQHVALQCYSIYLHLLFYSAHFHPCNQGYWLFSFNLLDFAFGRLQ